MDAPHILILHSILMHKINVSAMQDTLEMGLYLELVHVPFAGVVITAEVETKIQAYSVHYSQPLLLEPPVSMNACAYLAFMEPMEQIVLNVM